MWFDVNMQKFGPNVLNLLVIYLLFHETFGGAKTQEALTGKPVVTDESDMHVSHSTSAVSTVVIDSKTHPTTDLVRRIVVGTLSVLLLVGGAILIIMKTRSRLKRVPKQDRATQT